MMMMMVTQSQMCVRAEPQKLVISIPKSSVSCLNISMGFTPLCRLPALPQM